MGTRAYTTTEPFILERVRQASLSLDDGRRVTLTTSIGVITRGRGEDINTMMQRADQAMYTAKRQGGDRIIADPGAAA